jgi:hypothetical protein
MSSELQDVLEVISIVFTGIFTFEAVLKLLALDYHYFSDRWNIFDFLVVTVSLIEVLSTFAFNPTMIRIFRVFRLLRLLRLSRKARGVQNLAQTLIATLPSLIHVTLLLAIFFFMYAVLGVQLFYNVKHQEALTPLSDFSTFAKALYTLFRISTGENWCGPHETLEDRRECCRILPCIRRVHALMDDESTTQQNRACSLRIGGAVVL